MAGLFELQLPNETRQRRSSDNSEPRRSTSSARASSPTPGDTARDIVSQLVAKQQSTPSTGISSIFPWRRKGAANNPDSSGGSASPTGRLSGDTTNSRVSISPGGKNSNEYQSARPTIGRSYFPSTSPRQSLSAESVVGAHLSSSSIPSPPRAGQTSSRNAKAILAQAGLSLSLPQIAFPGPSSPISKQMPKKRKSSRPGTAPGHEINSSPTSPFAGSMRRIRSFSKLQEAQQGHDDAVPSGLPSSPHEFVDLSQRSRSSVLPHSMSVPDSISTISARHKGKTPERVSDVEAGHTSEYEDSDRGRQGSKIVSALGNRDRSLSKRVSWWPGRRRVDSSPAETRPPVVPVAPPPPIPVRSQHRPPPPLKTPPPSIPSLQPFSPFSNEFSVTQDTKQMKGSLDQSKTRDKSFSDTGGKPPSGRRRMSFGSRTSKPLPIIPSPSVQATQTSSSPPATSGSHSHSHSRSHRHSHSFGSDFRHTALGALLYSEHLVTPQPSELSSKRPKSPGESSSSHTTRRRSMTLFAKPPPEVSSGRETPLVLQQPINQTAVKDTEQVGSVGSAPLVESKDLHHTPSTSRGSMNSLGQAAFQSNSNTGRARSGNTPPTSGIQSLSGSTSSLPPPPSTSGRLLRRLSSTFFHSSTPAAMSPVDPSSSTSLTLRGTLGAGLTSSTTSDVSSSRSKESLTLAGMDGYRTSEEGTRKKPGKPPVPLPDEPPELFLRRLLSSVGRVDVVHVLASSGDEFHLQAMALYFSRFDFVGDPLDVAIRRLLMEIGLPRETQQIDRVMEAFAARYSSCNSDLFIDKDQPYILAFSLIMLHTDVFNKSNKNKMTKADYIKNAKLPGVPSEVLDCFFDNIAFAPFIFIEDPDYAPGKHQQTEGSSRFTPGSSPALSSSVLGTNGHSTLLGKATKIDPYYLITENLLDPLRADVESYIPPKNPYLFEGTDWPWDTQQLHQLFALAQQVQVNYDAVPPSVYPGGSPVMAGGGTPRRKSVAMPSFSLGLGYGPFLGSPGFSLDIPLPKRESTRILRIAKAGVLLRKDDTLEGGKKAINRKWKEWSVILTASQLLFFRDLSFASHLTGLIPGAEYHDEMVQEMLLHPDDVVSLHDTIAVFDVKYSKYPHAFRLFMPNGRQFIIQTSDRRTLNDWISAINYASSFRTAGVRMRGIGISYRDAEMTGVAAATSLLNDRRASAARAATMPSPTTPADSVVSGASDSAPELLKVLASRRLPEDALQIRNTFEEVKAELANGSPEPEAYSSPSTSPKRSRTHSMSNGSHSPIVTTTKQPRRPSTASSTSKFEEYGKQSNTILSRVDIIQARVDLLDSRINHLQQDLDDDLRLARNLAILTPFQRTTRDRVQASVLSLAKRVRALRIDLARLVCHRFVLLSDLAGEERDRERAKRDALQAATRRLSIEEARPPQLQLTIRGPAHPREESNATTASFHTALDGMENDNVLATPITMLPSGSHFTSEPQPILPEAVTPTQSPVLKPTELGAVEGHEKFYTAVEGPEEVAEEWNETRAAKRVSLIRVPSQVRLAVLNRQLRIPGDSNSAPQGTPRMAELLEPENQF
ncbi:hypothetical protein M422DRAFT_251332 [Sphaerobolus stellatus SS14]|uniref:Unplaced genomic scaffold SPHSTscaffold_38, whole genome shotgun sequence n=1 Tax=Sphaerobolus stellatus (strain SS14) TaxID=990650 RepID=A0A0C9VDK8_SPHS4|nr:hypothetical protein M422DRAFT_251332 [Sphaerobolus stellatus SS14]